MTNPFANAPGTATATAPAQAPAQFAPQPSNGFGAAPSQQFADAPSTEPAPAPKPATSGDPFADPRGPGSGERINQMVGLLVLVRPRELATNVTTSQGVADRVVYADIALLDGQEPGKICQNVHVYQKPLVRDLVAIMEDPGKALLIGRIARGNTTRTPDKAPYIFARATDEDKALAKQFLAMFPNF